MERVFKLFEFFKSTFILVALASAVVTTGCHEKKTGDGGEDDGPVYTEDYSGSPRNFTGSYTSSTDDGYCRLEIGGRVYTNCQISVSIKQYNRRFNITSTFRILNPASNRNASIKNVVSESLRWNDNVLTAKTGETGIVGKSAFRYQAATSELSMASDGLSKFRLSGSYLTESGEHVTIVGRIGFARRPR